MAGGQSNTDQPQVWRNALRAKLSAEQKEGCVHVRRVDQSRDTESARDVSLDNGHLDSIAVLPLQRDDYVTGRGRWSWPEKNRMGNFVFQRFRGQHGTSLDLFHGGDVTVVKTGDPGNYKHQRSVPFAHRWVPETLKSSNENPNCHTNKVNTRHDSCIPSVGWFPGWTTTILSEDTQLLQLQLNTLR